MSLTPGSRYGSYEILAPLGSGGMGEVYRARDHKLDRDVAFKVLRDEYASDAERLERFAREARAASALNHPHIVTIFDIGDAGGAPFIAMELIVGRTVREMLRQGPVPMRTVMEVATQAAEGLAKAHDAGIVHRDLKPENLMVTEDGFVKILDFGLAKLLRHPLGIESEGAVVPRSATRSGTLLGTVGYMSPEQASGRPVDHRTDQFSLGLVLYEMVAGERPFERRTAAQTMAAIIEAEAAALDEKNPAASAGLVRIVTRCMAKDPGDRFESTRKLAQALRELKESPAAAMEALRPPARALSPAVIVDDGRDFYVKTDDGIQRLNEEKLRKKLRKNSFNGLELVRREGEERWEVLHDSRIFLEEVPVSGDPRDAARWRAVQGFAAHLATFVALGIFFTAASGHFPFWMAFWGIGLFSHAIRALPIAVGLYREGGLSIPGLGAGRRGLVGRGRDQPRLLSAGFSEEVERVRSLLQRRKKGEGRALLAEIDALVASMSALAAKQADLEEQTSAEESARLREAEQEAQGKLAAAEQAYDRELLKRQLDVLGNRRRAMDKALVLLERMRVRRSMAEHQLKQLRLDLTQAEARRMEAPELSSRILDIRYEVDAFDEADEILARE